MSEFTASLIKADISEELAKKISEYRKSGVPVILDESLNALLVAVRMKNPREILEIGTATGCSGIAVLLSCGGRLTTVETDSDAFLSARANFEEFGVSDRVSQYYGDAGEVLSNTGRKFDFIFLDGPKAHYLEYLPVLKSLLNGGGVLFADNVLFRGYVDPQNKFPRRFITIVKRMRKFLQAVTGDPEFTSSVLAVGDGVLIAVKK